MSDTPEMITTTNEFEARQHLLTRKKKRKEILLPVPEWGMEVLLCSLTGTERAEYFAYNNATLEQYKAGTSEFFKRIWFEQVRLGCVHPVTRERILQPADRDEFMDDDDGAVIETLASIVRDISGLAVSSIEDAKKKLLLGRNFDIVSSLNDSTTKTEKKS